MRGSTVAYRKRTFYPAVASVEGGQDESELPDERSRLLSVTQVGLEHQLHQRHSRAVQVYQTPAGQARHMCLVATGTFRRHICDELKL